MEIYTQTNGCCCITFNYDDFLDEALAQTGSWNPYWGYGFFCPSSLDTIASFDELETHSVLRLLKLHGSINWRPKLGYASPVAIDSITHHHEWAGIGLRYPQVGGHLEPEPVMLPPVLSKSSLVEQPVLRLVWSQAFASLETAHEVTFIGYSFPTTDMAARTLFSETLKDLPRDDITVVNLSREDSEAEITRRRYRSVLGDMPTNGFISTALWNGYVVCRHSSAAAGPEGAGNDVPYGISALVGAVSGVILLSAIGG